MAKPRKSKNEDQKADNSGSVVSHQKLCLSIDMEKCQIYGYTELKIAVPESGTVGLHADNIKIDKVSVDGELAAYEFSPYYQPVEDDRRWHFVSSASYAADAACSTYLSSIDKEMVPNLLIKCCKPAKPVNDPQGQTNDGKGEPQVQANGENSTQSSSEPKQNFKLVRIDYWIEKAETGIHFTRNVLHTNNQMRRARCWFPCVDTSSQRCCYDLEFTVAQNLVAVSNGSLLYQVLSKEDPPRKTYVYSVGVPVAAGWISLAVAPFEILPDRHSGIVSHMCLPPNLSKLRNTVGFFHTAFSHYEEYLSAPFPLGSYKQVFIAPEMAISSLCLGASMSIFTSQVLFDEKVIDQTLDTRIKLAFALARQWFGVYITAEAPNDEWLLDGLAGFLTDSFIKRFLGNNEARYRRYKANCAVCKADVNGATALSSSASSSGLYGTQCIGLYGKIRSWKSVAVLQMLEKQMGPESFRKVRVLEAVYSGLLLFVDDQILQMIILRAQNTTRPLRTLTTKEFRHFANKVGNLERPFLKEFFPRWVGSCGCPVLRMGLSYNKRKNLIELAVLRGCTAMPDSIASVPNGNSDSETQEGDVGWPGMMSIRVHELDGMYDHPILPMTGESWQLLEIQLHSKLAARRIQKPKKGSKPDGSDDNGEVVPSVDMRSSVESPLLWIRADPEMEYLAEVHFSQPIQMWINQLEKDKDVVAQSQAIATLEALPQFPFSVVNALNNFLSDSKAFWRVRIEAAFALAHTASEETDWAGLLHLVKFYKNRRFDPNIGLPRPNDFHDFPEYFVLEAIPHAIATIRAADKKSPREAVEFVLQLLKAVSAWLRRPRCLELLGDILPCNLLSTRYMNYMVIPGFVLLSEACQYNDNSGNPYSDVYWLAALVQSVGELEFGRQSILFLSSLLKRIDRLLQFDRLMPSYNGILTISCIRTLTQIALKLAASIPLDHVFHLIKPFRNAETHWQVRIEACRALLDIEFHSKGIDSALSLFLKFLEEEASLRGQVKLAVHAMRICQIRCGSESDDEVRSPTLVALLHLLESRKAFNNVFLRHYLFCILQILARRPPTLYGVPRIQLQPMGNAETCSEQKNKSSASAKLQISQPQGPVDARELPPDGLPNPEAGKDTDTISNGNERRMPVVKIRVRQSATSSRAEEAENTVDRSQGGHNENEQGASSSMSVDAPQRVTNEPVSTSKQNVEEVNSCYDHGSRMTASIGSAKLMNDDDEIRKELQCTADSRKGVSQPESDDRSSPGTIKGSNGEARKYASLQTLSLGRNDQDRAPMSLEAANSREKEKVKKKKKDKEKKRKREEKDERKGHRDDPEYLERKRLKKEKKQKEKEMAMLLSEEAKPSVGELQSMKEEARVESAKVELKTNEPSVSKVVIKSVETKSEASEGVHKLRIKFKNRSLNQP